jgi:hypothetical protein
LPARGGFTAQGDVVDNRQHLLPRIVAGTINARLVERHGETQADRSGNDRTEVGGMESHSQVGLVLPLRQRREGPQRLHVFVEPARGDGAMPLDIVPPLPSGCVDRKDNPHQQAAILAAGVFNAELEPCRSAVGQDR